MTSTKSVTTEERLNNLINNLIPVGTAFAGTVTATSAQTVLAIPVSSGVQLDMKCWFLLHQGSGGGTANLNVTGPSASTASIGWYQTTGTGTALTYNSGVINSATLSATSFQLYINGYFVFTAAGTLEIGMWEGTSGDSILVQGSTMVLTPV